MPRKSRRPIRGAGSVYQRKDGRWVGSFIVEETGKRKYLYGATQDEAYKKLQQALFDQKKGSLITSSQATMKLSDFLTYWIENIHCPPTVRVSTYVKHRSEMKNHIIPALGNLQLRKLTTEHLETFYSGLLRKGCSVSLVHSIHNMIHGALKHAVYRKYVAVNVSDNISLPSKKSSEIHPLTVDQAKILLEHARGHRLETLIVMAVSTGMRRGELLALTWRNVDFKTGMLSVQRSVNRHAGYGFVENDPKTASGKRSITLPNMAIHVLKQHRLHQEEMKQKAGAKWVDKDLVFANGFGNFLQPDYYTGILFARLLKEAGLPHIRFHDLRHSAATILLSLGVHPKIVQELLGHSNISITLNVYSHVLPSLQKDAMSKVDDLFGEDGK